MGERAGRGGGVELEVGVGCGGGGVVGCIERVLNGVPEFQRVV